MGLVQNTAETASTARARRYISQATVISIDAVAHTAQLDVGALDQNGNPVYVPAVPYSPQTPPAPGATVTLGYSGDNMHGMYIAGVQLGGTLPQSSIQVLGGAVYQGTWNASTNSPALVSSVGTAGYFYRVSVAGTTAIDGVATWAVGDLIWFMGGVWVHVSGAIGPLLAANNLSDVASAGAALSNLGGIAANGSIAFSGNQSMGSNKLTNLATPTASTDAVNKAYADAIAAAVIDAEVAAITAVFNGAGSALAAGTVCDVYVPYGFTITSVTLLADQSGDAVVDIWSVGYSSYPATSGNSICAADLPTLASAINGQDSALTGWTISIPAGACLRFHLNSAATITRLTVVLTVDKT